MSQKSEKKIRRTIKGAIAKVQLEKQAIVLEAVEEVQKRNIFYRIWFSLKFAKAIIFVDKDKFEVK
jgi:hypothetical protein